MGNILLGVIGVVIAAGSLIVAIIALLKSLGAQKEANEVQRRLVGIEEKREIDREGQARKAVLRPSLRKTDKASYRLQIANDGMEEARNVRVLLDGQPSSKHCTAVGGDTIPALIGPNSTVSCLLAVHMQCAPPFDIEISWEDDSGDAGSFKGVLTF
jgi:hypothetical protein